MMKKNTILKILSFVLVLTMVVAAVLLTGCGNKKEDPKASQEELDAAKAALEAAQAEIEKIQANIDKMTKDGSATADDLKKAQEELEAAQKALDELAKASTSEEVYNALYGEDSDKTLAKYQAKVVELADAKRNIEYIVGYGKGDLALADLRAGNEDADDNWDEDDYVAFYATPVGAVEAKCLSWMASRLALATSTKVVDQVWADMEAAFAGIKKIVDKYDDELASLLPDANGGKLTLIKTDKDGNKIDQLADLNAYRDWILEKSAKLKFNGATDEVAEPKKAEYDAIKDAYAKLDLVYDANDYAEKELVTDYGTKDNSAIEYEHKNTTENNKNVVKETDKDANEKVGKFFTDFVLYYEVTVKELNAERKQVDKVYVYSTTEYNKDYTKVVGNTAPVYMYSYKDGEQTKTNTLVPQTTEDKFNGKYKVKLNGSNTDTIDVVTAKAFKFADVFNKEANVDAKYYVAVDVTKDLSANATYFARKARYEQLNAAKAEFATLFTKLANLKALGGKLPYMSQVAKVDVDLDALSAWMAKYDLVLAELIDTEDLVGNALTEALEANAETTALNAVKETVLKQILGMVDKKNAGASTFAFGKLSTDADYAFIKYVMGTVNELKKIQAELVTPAVKGTTMSLSALFESWKTNTVETVKYADYETIYQDVINRIDGIDKDGDEDDVLGITARLNAIYAGEYAGQKNEAYEDMIGQKSQNRLDIDALINRAKELNTVNDEVEKLAVAFRDGGTVSFTTAPVAQFKFVGLTKQPKATDDLTGKETTTKKNDKDELITLYWVVDFKYSDEMAAFDAAVDSRFSDRGLLPTEEDAVAKENYDLITKTAKEFLAQANTTFENTKKAFQDAYEQVKHVIYTIEKDEETEENTLVATTGDMLYDLGNILWAKGIIDTLEKEYPDATFTMAEDVTENNVTTKADGKFIVDSFKLNEDDEYDTVIKYADFRNALNDAVSTAIRTASRANAAANTTIVAKLDAKDTTATGKKLSEYAGLNQNEAVDTVVTNFRNWCATYLGAKQDYKVDVLDDDGNPTGATTDEPYTDTEFFANVEKYFVTATADGKAIGILGIKNGNTPYAFVSADTFATIKKIDAEKDDKEEAARVDFLAILNLNNKKLLPAFATVEDIDSVCFSFVEYVKAYYMPDGESAEAVYEYYKTRGGIEGVTEANKSQTAAQTKIKNFAAAEKLVDKAARYATYIDTGIDFVINPKAKTLTYVEATEKELYTGYWRITGYQDGDGEFVEEQDDTHTIEVKVYTNGLKDFIDTFYKVEKLTEDENTHEMVPASDAISAGDFFTAYSGYDFIVTADGNQRNKAN